MRKIFAWFQVLLHLSISFSDAEKNVADEGSSMVTEKTVYEIVQKALMSKFHSIDEEIKRKISVQTRLISRRSDLRLLWSLNERVSRLENEKQTMKENRSSEENDKMKNLEEKAQNLSKIMQNLESRITFHENRSMTTNVSTLGKGRNINFSAYIGNFETTLNDSTSKIELLQINQQNLSQFFENLESRISATNHETRRLLMVPNAFLDEKITNVSDKMRNYEKALDDLEFKLDDLVKTVSFPHLQLINDFSKRLKDVKLELLNYIEAFHGTMETRLNDSVWMTQELEIFKNQSSSIKNILNTIKSRFIIEGSNFNTSVFSLEENMQIMESNITQITDEINRSKIEMSTLKQNLFETMDKAMSRLNESIITKTSDIKDQVKDLVQNISEIHFKIENNFNNSLKNIREEVHSYKRENKETSAGLVQKCVELTSRLEKSVDEKVILSVVNLTKSINFTNNQLDLQRINLNQSMSSVDEKVMQLQLDKSSLVAEIAETKKELSEVKRNETMRTNNLHYRITELESNISSVGSEMEAKQAYLTISIAKNISKLNDNYLSLRNSLSKDTSLITLHIQDLTQNMSIIEKELESQLITCDTNIAQSVQNQTEKIKNLLIEVSQIIDTKWSSYSESLYKKISIVENDIIIKNKQLSSRVDQLSGNINNMLRKVSSLESSNNGQTTRLSSIEYRLTTVSTTLRTLRSDFDSNIPKKGPVRLVNGGSTYGRVELFYNGAWGTICDDSWDNNDAQVVCRMMGLRGGTAKQSAYYGQGSGSIWLDEVGCRGSELSIYTCSNVGIGTHDCGHGEDAGVICTSR